jgi:hypothetical protein
VTDQQKNYPVTLPDLGHYSRRTNMKLYKKYLENVTFDETLRIVSVWILYETILNSGYLAMKKGKTSNSAHADAILISSKWKQNSVIL